MKYLLKIFIFSILLISASNMRAQATNVPFTISHNIAIQLLESYIYTSKDNAVSMHDQFQFNVQFSFLTQAISQIEITSDFLSMYDNEKILELDFENWRFLKRNEQGYDLDYNNVKLINNKIDEAYYTSS